jgi:hypothetical protein
MVGKNHATGSNVPEELPLQPAYIATYLESISEITS